MSTRQCPHCGKIIDSQLQQCPHCREAVGPQVDIRRSREKKGGPEIRKGLLWILVASVLHYYLHGHDPFVQIPLEIHPYVVEYFIPLLFLAGTGLVLMGIYKRITS